MSRIPDDEDDPSSTVPARSSYRLAMEFYILEKLTQMGCTCTPKLLDSFFSVQTEDLPVPGGFFAIIVMERLPGRNLANFGDLPMAERDQVRIAFGKALREFFALGFRHEDPDRRNVMWDPKNKKWYVCVPLALLGSVARSLNHSCVAHLFGSYIIDFEYAYHVKDADSAKFTPMVHYPLWGLAGPMINTSLGGLDPMVPCEIPTIRDPDDETLERMAAEAAGKPLKPQVILR
ncbi:predicted protein [Uncinocarpus reesii 1704]|uniref:Aminoglycoside phosphotransferase domain-containing protein n=1 Tax=Uncinocarpus reesii (strain UAMH 1704) TaxID=336963 RepID=C4JZT4_UNCRE|nr:uncharacterized protein UREG_07685 [Uncinocarpus reesii 1704]EEP82820.1 predicted protein [Uncinocarpus reesii 1704]